jgi:hypothetical protein
MRAFSFPSPFAVDHSDDSITLFRLADTLGVGPAAERSAVSKNPGQSRAQEDPLIKTAPFGLSAPPKRSSEEVFFLILNFYFLLSCALGKSPRSKRESMLPDSYFTRGRLMPAARSAAMAFRYRSTLSKYSSRRFSFELFAELRSSKRFHSK